MRPKRGSDVMVDALIAHGVKYLPGITGNTILDILDSMYDRPEIRYINIHHEQVGAGMANGYARVSGEVGTLITHVGPGVCQASIGIADAYRDSIPVVLITGNQDQDKLGRDQWHELDQLGLLRPITKWSTRIERVQDIPRVLRAAFQRARVGRPGPVHVDIPKDVSATKVEDPAALGPVGPRPVSTRVAPDPAATARVCEMLLQAKAPVLIAGGGVYWSGAGRELTEVAEILEVPVVTTNTARGVIPDDHPLCFGVIGQFGGTTGNNLVRRSDFVLAVGSKLSDVATLTWSLIPKGAPIVQVDLDTNELARQYPIELGLLADAKQFLAQLLEAAAKLKGRGPRSAEALLALPRIREAQAEKAAELDRFYGTDLDAIPIKPQRIPLEVSKAIRRDAIIAAGPGVHPQFTSKIPVYQPGCYVKSTGLGAMGVAFPQAMGAKLARPERQVLCLTGDGDFHMTAQDLETCVREGIAVVSVVYNDVGYGSLRAFQRRGYGGRYIGNDYNDVDFGKLAEVYGALGARVTDPKALGPVLRRFLDSGQPAVIDVMIDPAEEAPRFKEIKQFLGIPGDAGR
ncbi:MAG: thiamine pyrophosphate-binding protein [Deltaproteobacteria bacterium]|nr:thiamine pyrophosphate-binding protein [Deltaproteobacteria bacterium]